MINNNFELIPSFQVDHTKIKPGIYISRIDVLGEETVTTFDVRMKYPNSEPAIHPNAMHSIEHIVATYMRNNYEWKNKVIYWGPMGCLTGFYLIVKGAPSPKEIYPLVLDSFKYLYYYEGDVPGATPANCGNYLLHDLNMAKFEAGVFVSRLEEDPCFEYPAVDLMVTENGDVFFDS